VCDELKETAKEVGLNINVENIKAVVQNGKTRRIKNTKGNVNK
jgi:hypothetical protein